MKKINDDMKQKINNMIMKYGLNSLMAKKKEELGHEPSELVFIGVADVAKYWYCAKKSLFKQLEMEPEFFNAYLQDRILYSIELGYLRRLPSSERELLKIGDEITLIDIEKLLKEEVEESKELLKELTTIRKALVKENKVELDLVNRFIKVFIKKFGGSEENPLDFGTYAEYLIAEPYATIRWNFPYKDFVVIGAPDGITDNFVYEFKASANLFFTLRNAKTQADIYGYFFHRDKKRVQVYLKTSGKIITEENGIDKENAEITLERATGVYRGEPPKPPKPYKCNSCEYKIRCPIYHSSLA